MDGLQFMELARQYCSTMIRTGFLLALSTANVHGAVHGRSNTRSTEKAARPMRVRVDMNYAQSRDFYPTIDLFSEKVRDFDTVAAFLSGRYGLAEEGYAEVSVGIDHLKLSQLQPVFSDLDFSVSAQSAGFGLIRDPVIPEIRAHVLWGGVIRAGLSQTLRSSRVRYRLGLTWGAAKEIRIQAVSTDLIDKIPRRKGGQALYGGELSIDRPTRFNDSLLWTPKLYIRESLFRSDVPPPNEFALYDPEFEKEWRLTHLWSVDNKMGWTPGPHYIGMQFLFGNHPLPKKPAPELSGVVREGKFIVNPASMIGIGTFWNGKIPGTPIQTAFRFGNYGGYWGGSLHLQFSVLTVGAESWGIENSLSYQGVESRIYQANLGLKI